MISSHDGTNWTLSFSQGQVVFDRVVFGNGVFAALGRGFFDDPILLTSTNGEEWVAVVVESDELIYFRSLDFAGGLFLANSYSPYALYTSSDTRNWIPHTNSVAPQGVAFGNGVYAAVNGSDPNPNTPLCWSTNGTDWMLSPFQFGPRDTAFNVAFGNGRFVALGVDSNSVSKMWISTDGQSWQFGATNTYALDTVTFFKDAFFAAGKSGVILKSFDGVSWTDEPSGTGQETHAFAADDTELVLAADGGEIWRTRGSDWIALTGTAKPDLWGITFANDRFTAVGDNGTVLSSSNGVAWAQANANTGKDLHHVTYGNGLYVAVGKSGTIVTSRDTLTWKRQTSPTTNYLQHVAWGAGKFVAVGDNSTIITSPDGTNWMVRDSGVPNRVDWQGVEYGAGWFIAVGGFFSGQAIAAIAKSSDGTNWTTDSAWTWDIGVILRTVRFGESENRFAIAGNDLEFAFVTTPASPTLGFQLSSILFASSTRGKEYQNVRGLAWGAGRFVGVGNDGLIFSTACAGCDGWDERRTLTGINLHDVAFGHDTFVAVGNNGAIIQSPTVTPRLNVAADGSTITINVQPGDQADYRIQTSSNLVEWLDAATVTDNANISLRLDSPTAERQFYRVVSP